MALSLLQTARPGRTADRIQRNDARESVPDLPRPRLWPVGTDQRDSPQISEVLHVPWLYPIQQLFHDYDFSNASPGAAVDVGTSARYRYLRPACLARLAFRADAAQEVI